MESVKVEMVGSGTVGDLQGWSVQENSTPVSPAEGSAGVGNVSLSAIKTNTSKYIVDNDATFTHRELGDVVGLVDQPRTPKSGTVSSFNVIPIASLLLADRLAPPTGAQPLSEIFADYVALVTDLITVDYQGTLDPVKVYPGWRGDVWRYLNQLAVINKLEIVMVGTSMVVRDLGTRIYEAGKNLSSSVDPSVTASTRSTARKVPAVCYNPKLISSLPGVKYNYSPNPSLETNTANWSGGWSPAGLNPTFTRVAANPLSGAFSYRMLATVADSGIGQFIEARHSIDTTSIPDGEAVALSISAYYSFVTTAPTVTGARFEAWYRWAGGSVGAGVEVQFGTYQNPGARVVTGRANFSDSLIKPTGATTLILYIRQVTRAAAGGRPVTRIVPGDTIWIDGVLLTNGALIPFADGNSPGWAWTGGTNNSISSTTIPVENDFYNALKDDNQIYSVEAGETKETIIRTTNYPTFLAQPIAVNTPAIQVGQYFVSAADNLPVVAAEWLAYGGKVEVALSDEDPGTIVLTMTGPRIPIPGVPGPYSLAASDGKSEYATLSIAGIGVITTPEDIVMLTAADPAKTTTELAPTIDWPFLDTRETVYDSCIWACQDAAGPTVTLTLGVIAASLEGFGLSEGAIITYDECNYRIQSISFGGASATITARWYTTLDAFDAQWIGQTVDAFDALWSGYSAGDVDIAPLRST